MNSGEPTAIVLDTNVFVGAGFNPASASARIISEIRAGRLRMNWNDATRREIERILRKIPPLSRMEIADLFRDENRYEENTHAEQFTHVPDPDDRKFAALANATGAVLVTSDDHLLSARGQARAPIQTPGEFWERFQRGTQR
ncbi:MAG: PIN domain-containing protein [Planctomycetes bacterium]|nr:PIN domain-containing protein [Planctomycetota bacterium]